jgi:hypothetical protein
MSDGLGRPADRRLHFTFPGFGGFDIVAGEGVTNMPANKKAKKSGGSATAKKKASAPQHAAQREQRQQGRAAATATTRRSAKKISQSRYPGETPLTGEDRPSRRAGGKRGQGSSRKRTAR